MSKAVIYVRVSTKDQNYNRQISDLQAVAKTRGWEVIETITEKISGSKTKRPGIEKLFKLAESGAIQKVLVSEVSRLGRNTEDVLATIRVLTEHKVSVLINNHQLETLNADGKKNSITSLILTILAEISAMEKETMVERINSGLAQAKKEGKHLGRPEGTKKSKQIVMEEYKGVIKSLNKGLSVRETAKVHGISNNTVMKVKKVMLKSNE